VVGVSGTAILCIEHTPTYPQPMISLAQKVKGFVDNLTILSSWNSEHEVYPQWYKQQVQWVEIRADMSQWSLMVLRWRRRPSSLVMGNIIDQTTNFWEVCLRLHKKTALESFSEKRNNLNKPQLEANTNCGFTSDNSHSPLILSLSELHPLNNHLKDAIMYHIVHNYWMHLVPICYLNTCFSFCLCDIVLAVYIVSALYI